MAHSQANNHLDRSPEAGAYLLTMSSEDYPEPSDAISAYNGIQDVVKSFSDLEEVQHKQAVKRCIRFMFCANVSKKPVKREDLSRYMFSDLKSVAKRPGDARMFNEPFQQAQQTFKETFGMKIVELKKQVKTRRRNSTGSSQPTKAYILVSTLPKELRPVDEEYLPFIGFMSVVASMIVMSPGCRIQEQELYAALKRLEVHVREKKGHKQLNGGNVKELLEKRLVEQWYLEREKETNMIYYGLGPRLRAELSDDDLIEFVSAVYRQGGNPLSGLDESGRQMLKMRLKEAWGPLGPPNDTD